MSCACVCMVVYVSNQEHHTTEDNTTVSMLEVGSALLKEFFCELHLHIPIDRSSCQWYAIIPEVTGESLL
jgi:hypothetical protein